MYFEVTIYALQQTNASFGSEILHTHSHAAPNCSVAWGRMSQNTLKQLYLFITADTAMGARSPIRRCQSAAHLHPVECVGVASITCRAQLSLSLYSPQSAQWAPVSSEHLQVQPILGTCWPRAPDSSPPTPQRLLPLPAQSTAVIDIGPAKCMATLVAP
jgi:hypothetical protein